MLQLSDEAARELSAARAARGLSDDYALRVHGTPRAGMRGLRLQFAQEPAHGDEVGESGGLRVFVASDVAETLDDLIVEFDETAPNGSRYRLRSADAPGR